MADSDSNSDSNKPTKLISNYLLNILTKSVVQFEIYKASSVYLNTLDFKEKLQIAQMFSEYYEQTIPDYNVKYAKTTQAFFDSIQKFVVKNFKEIVAENYPKYKKELEQSGNLKKKLAKLTFTD